MNYEEMSDFEINMLVAMAEGLIVNELQSVSLKAKSSSVLFDDIVSQFEFNPCNSPSDAWPIILDNNITLLFSDSGDCEVSFDYRCTDTDETLTSWVNIEKHKKYKILRAAMICFLKMKDMQNEL